MSRLNGMRGAAIDVAPALMMGAAVATLCLLAPIELLERAVMRLNLDLLVHAARPPLGLTARLGTAGVGFAGAALAVFVALRLVGRLLPRRHAIAPEERFEPAPPPVRVGRPLPVHAVAELPAGLFTDPGFHAPQPEPVAPEPERQGSIAELLSRLERAR